ncbi:MAG: TRAP transporter small permease subunit [Rhodospirillaceae bacterium]|jgi:TRAP-type mannitol/chloroaromatic compound transport system permease small subunit|nr:TRAP transporter small permease subunit [Rhodospirillaceae bacterium]MBT4046578.1 TRAP transporter small permease subunit [Rhodospirillaceae bacterium]MBT4690860.1 TRAP transporter small permease subunit [Rhodospirillaceae bacterium]MBT5081559.1 TRAP transporter small permease subunit [Rhodospirillaceae bacterium]MBT5527001.1 TRAP transporter small permease subunit [Rhodospirillaceae bacterium]
MVSILSWVVRLLDGINEYVGRTVSWLTVFMVLVVTLIVIMRYIFSIGFIWMQESYVWAHAIVFMLGAGYTLLHDGHVRIDIFYRTASQTYRDVVNIVGCIIFVLPICWIIFDRSIGYITRSFGVMESSAEAGGMPFLFVLKGMIWGFSFLLAIQAISLILRSLLSIAGHQVEPNYQDENAA